MTYGLATPMRRAAHDDVCCKAALPSGKQCTYVAEDGQEYCRKHRHLDRNNHYQYKTVVNLPSIPRSQLFDLTAEVDLLKRLIALRAQMLTDEDSVLLYSGHVASLLQQLQKLIDGAIKLEQAKQELLPRTVAMQLIGSIMDAVADVVQSPEILDQIHGKIEQILSDLERNP